MIPILIIAVLFCLFMIVTIRSSGGRRRARKAQARMWQEAEARGDITILDDRGSDRPTLAIKRHRD